MGALSKVSWEVFAPAWQKRWQQGEHVFVSAQTGGGKTELLLKLFDLAYAKQFTGGKHLHQVFMVTKPKDPIFKTEFAKGYKKTAKFEPNSFIERQMISPPNGATTAEMVAIQQDVYTEAFDKIYHSGGYMVGIDELAYMAEYLKLAHPIATAHHMGRALGLSYFAATQRPRRLPVIVPQSASHAFVGKTGRKDDLATLSELGGDPQDLKEAIASLRNKHDFVYVDTQSEIKIKGQEMPIMIVNTRE